MRGARRGAEEGVLNLMGLRNTGVGSTAFGLGRVSVWGNGKPWFTWSGGSFRPVFRASRRSGRGMISCLLGDLFLDTKPGDFCSIVCECCQVLILLPTYSLES